MDRNDELLVGIRRYGLERAAAIGAREDATRAIAELAEQGYAAGIPAHVMARSAGISRQGFRAIVNAYRARRLVP